MATKKAHLFVIDRVRTNQMPNMVSLYEQARTTRLSSYEDYPVPEEDFSFEVRVDTESRRVSVARLQIRSKGLVLYNSLLIVWLIHSV